MSADTRFWDKISEKYSKSPVSDEASYQHKLEETRAFLKPDMKMLEIGCGTGSTAIVHAPNVREILATDVSDAMLDIARAKAVDAGIDNITFRQASIEALELEEGSFDVVLGMSILHLLDDKDAAIAKVFRLLKPGGRFISSTVCMDDNLMFRMVVMVAPIGKAFGLLPHLAGFGRKELEASIVQAGFGLEEVWQPGKGKAVFIIARKPE